jgi:hypothetical protein
MSQEQKRREILHTLRILTFAFLILILAACGSTFDQTDLPTPAETGGQALPAADTVDQLRQPVKSLESPTAASMATVTPLPSPTPEPLPSPTIPGQIGPDYFPPGVNPLTGEVVPDPGLLERRPLAIKVANMDRVRPQSGLNQADLVFEHYSEGGITRFTAIFYTHAPRRVGSIRSARLIDLEIPLMYDAAFGFSGSSHQIKEMIRESFFFDRVISPDYGHSGFWRTFDAKNPSPFHVDSLFTDTTDLRQTLVERGQEHAPDLKNGMTFHPDPPPGGMPARRIEIVYSGTGILWEYQPSIGRYYRWSDGERHLDAATGEFMNFKNIVLVQAQHVNTEIIEDTGGSPSIQIQLWGQGPVVIFRDGQRYDGLWKREDPEEMLTFYDNDGQALPLSPGNTFFEVVPLDFSRLTASP